MTEEYLDKTRRELISLEKEYFDKPTRKLVSLEKDLTKFIFTELSDEEKIYFLESLEAWCKNEKINYLK